MILKDAEPFEAYDCKTGGCGYEGESFDAYVNGMQHVLEDLDSAPEIDPESLLVVQQLRVNLERSDQEMQNLLKAIESLYKQRDDLRAELEKVKTERDAAIKDVFNSYNWISPCPACKKHDEKFCIETGKFSQSCFSCMENKFQNWEWRGVKEK